MSSWITLTWLLVADVDIETQNNDIGEESSPPVDDKHHHTAEDGPSQRDPHVVVFEAGTPPCSTNQHKSQNSNQQTSLEC